MTIPPPAWVVDRLAGSSRALGIELAPEACAALGEYTALVVAWGARVNLTGARTPEAFIDEQVADALALLPHLPAGRFRYVDVGTGAGLPGLVITILRAEASGVLLEPVGKKRAFVSHAVRELGLTSRVEVRGERLTEHLERGGACAYDVAVSRAVWPAAEWLERGRPLLRAGGVLLGVEGAAAAGLPPGAARHPYQLAGRSRAVITLRA